MVLNLLYFECTFPIVGKIFWSRTITPSFVVMPVVRSPGFRFYLSPSFARSMDTRPRDSPSGMASPSAGLSPANAHTSVDIATVRRSPNAMASPAGAHTSADASDLPTRSRKRWDDFIAIFDDNGTLMQDQCIHCDTIFQTTKKTGSSQCRRHRWKWSFFITDVRLMF